MRIGVIGAGRMGEGLARLWVRAGHEVMLGFSRDASELEETAKRVGVESGSVEEVVGFGEVVALTVPWGAREAALSGVENALSGKTVISSVMALKPDISGIEVGFDTSAAEELAKLIPKARLVESFNSIFAQALYAESSEISGVKPSVFYCGDDAEATETTAALIRDAGFDPVNAGPLTNARYLEPFAMLNLKLAYSQGYGPGIGIRLLREESE